MAGAVPAQYKATGTLTADNLRAICDAVSISMGSDVRIFGTKAALRKVMGLANADWISNEMKQERHMTGLLGIWEGIECVEIEQVWERNQVGTPKIAENQLFIVPTKDEKFIKLVNEGDVRVLQVSDGNTLHDMTEEYEIQAKLGCALLMNGCMGIYDSIA